ncbi:MAG: methylase [Clostridium sp.]|nr:methylase [Clostridium sp.]
MNDTQQKEAAKQFASYWKGKGYEKGESQAFWLSLLRDVYGVEHPEQFITFEEQVHLDHTSFIDGTIPSTKVLIEQKGLGKDLKKPIKQSDGTLLTPFQQAKRYITELPLSQHPRWVVTCNFEKFFVYDMERPGGEPEEILMENLPTEYYRLSFLVNSENVHLKREMEVSIAAGEMVGLLYDAFRKQYADPYSECALKSLNILCVRLVFCLYAEDAGIFGHHGMFHDYLAEYDTRHMRKALIELFQVLDTAPEDRDPYLKDDNPDLAAFPYVNGGLFANEDIEIPPFTDEIRSLLLNKASSDFNWSEISPTIFGAVFESTLNPETRRSGGMHYTSIENIHKVIDPLFLDDLKKEFEEICEIAVEKTRERKLKEFQKKLASLTFLDPACGSGNFLTETYLSLRHLENEVLRILSHGQISFGDADWNPIQVSIGQFYGIEINDFAVTVAKTALWIAESQMMKETEEIVLMHLDFLPLKSYTNIIEGNALQINWEDVAPKCNLSYVMGNPPFVGKKEQTPEQKKDLLNLYGKGISGVGNMDYVTGWYIKAAEYMQGTKIHTAFVSTNSITQGEQPSVLWTKLQQYGTNIIFAYRTFIWASEATMKAHVHCVIIGFCNERFVEEKHIFTDTRYVLAENINPYLVDAPTVLIRSRSKPLADVPEMCYGSMPIDNNNLILDEESVQQLLKENPENEQFIREYVGGEELLKGKKRWCIWLDGVDPTLYMKSKFIMGRIEANRQYRLYGSTRPQTNKAAETPQLFGEIRQPQNGALVIPKVSSEDRRYIPISYVKPGVIINGSALMIPNASLYHFGILSSNVHNSWMRVVAGRMKSDYQYSAGMVYNTFPWPNASQQQIEAIKKAAKAILDAREQHTNINLANMYKEKNFILFGDLKTAHDNLNRAVMKAYGFSVKEMTESMCVAELMKMYQKLVDSES